MKNDEFDLSEFGLFEKESLQNKHKYILLFFILSYAGILIAVQNYRVGIIRNERVFYRNFNSSH